MMNIMAKLIIRSTPADFTKAGKKSTVISGKLITMPLNEEHRGFLLTNGLILDKKPQYQPPRSRVSALRVGFKNTASEIEFDPVLDIVTRFGLPRTAFEKLKEETREAITEFMNLIKSDWATVFAALKPLKSGAATHFVHEMSHLPNEVTNRYSVLQRTNRLFTIQVGFVSLELEDMQNIVPIRPIIIRRESAIRLNVEQFIQQVIRITGIAETEVRKGIDAFRKKRHERPQINYFYVPKKTDEHSENVFGICGSYMTYYRFSVAKVSTDKREKNMLYIEEYEEPETVCPKENGGLRGRLLDSDEEPDDGE